jgi:hypothetical protein
MEHLVAFKAISNFVSDLDQEFATTYHPVALYNRLLERTKISNDLIIKKHVSLFHDFVVANRDGILENDIHKFTKSTITYSERVYINLIDLYKKGDKNAKSAIHQHLLAISALLDPASNAKQVLANSMKSSTGSSSNGGKEEEFINELITKVEGSINPTDMDNPIKAVTSIMSSGVFNDLVTSMSDGINSGNLDIGKLMTTMTTVMTGMNGGAGGQGQPPMPDLGNLLTTLSGVMAPPKQ